MVNSRSVWLRHQFGRVIVNQIIPTEIGYFNGIISKKSLRGLIADVIKAVGMARACEFLDGIKNLGYRMAYVAGLPLTSTISSFLMRKLISLVRVRVR